MLIRKHVVGKVFIIGAGAHERTAHCALPSTHYGMGGGSTKYNPEDQRWRSDQRTADLQTLARCQVPHAPTGLLVPFFFLPSRRAHAAPWRRRSPRVCCVEDHVDDARRPQPRSPTLPPWVGWLGEKASPGGKTSYECDETVCVETKNFARARRLSTVAAGASTLKGKISSEGESNLFKKRTPQSPTISSGKYPNIFKIFLIPLHFSTRNSQIFPRH